MNSTLVLARAEAIHQLLNIEPGLSLSTLRVRLLFMEEPA
jgi:hypothetical protein